MTADTPWRSPPPALRSSSTVTNSTRSNSPTTSSYTPPTRFFDEYRESVQPSSPTPRTLPRAGLVNFRREGDSLRWAPRVTQNTAGLAARVHDFADAFELEEFSSRALPYYQCKSPIEVEEIPLVYRTDKDNASSSASQRSLVRSDSAKKTVVLAAEIARPSFWSLLAHTNRYQRTKARLHAEDSYRNLKAFARNIENEVKLSGSRRSTRRYRRNGKSATSLFRRLWKTLDRRSSKKQQAAKQHEKEPEKENQLEDEGPSKTSSSEQTSEDTSSDSKARIVFEKPKPPLFAKSRPSDVQGFPSSRRAVSSMSGRRERKKSQPGAVNDDQYVTFITSVV